jgi:hypothetical protein
MIIRNQRNIRSLNGSSKERERCQQQPPSLFKDFEIWRLKKERRLNPATQACVRAPKGI